MRTRSKSAFENFMVLAKVVSTVGRRNYISCIFSTFPHCVLSDGFQMFSNVPSKHEDVIGVGYNEVNMVGRRPKSATNIIPT